ncbi:phosphotransferase family protein [Oceanobacillus sp. CAU 1775]
MEAAFRDTIQVREGEEIRTQTLIEFIKKHLPETPVGHLEIEQFSAGHSNLTYLLRIGSWEAVLRRPPLGPVAKKAHDMEREYTILSQLHPHFQTAPKPFVFSDDEAVIGSPFFIMERRKGIVLDTEFPKGYVYKPSDGRKISELMVDKLVDLHQVDYRKTDLLQISKPEGFMERQVGGWIKRYEQAKTDEIKNVDRLTAWLGKNIPSAKEYTIIHYDYKLNNAMFSTDFSEMTGLFDWEMTTIGDPLADLGAAMSYWIQADDPKIIKYGLGDPFVTVMDGFFTRDEFLESYANKSGRDLTNIHYYITFAYFKLAVICQQIYYRYKKGQTNDIRFAHFDRFVQNLIQHAVTTAKDI